MIRRRDPKDPDYGLLEGSKYLDWKVFKKSGEEEKKDENKKQSLVLVHFSDRILNYKAEELGMMVHLQDMYQTLPFVLEGQQNFVRFNASQKIRLFTKIFEEEFDIPTLRDTGVIIGDPIMCHTVNRNAIMESF